MVRPDCQAALSVAIAFDRLEPLSLFPIVKKNEKTMFTLLNAQKEGMMFIEVGLKIDS